MRVCAIDPGDARTGLAFSDIGRSIAGETLVIHEKNRKKLVARLAAEILARGAGLIAVGCPVNMDGTRGEAAEKSERLAAALREAAGLPVRLIDERRTTADAHRILTETGVFRQKRKDTVDAVAAALILETFLGILKNENNSQPEV